MRVSSAFIADHLLAAVVQRVTLRVELCRTKCHPLRHAPADAKCARRILSRVKFTLPWATASALALRALPDTRLKVRHLQNLDVCSGLGRTRPAQRIPMKQLVNLTPAQAAVPRVERVRQPLVPWRRLIQRFCHTKPWTGQAVACERESRVTSHCKGYGSWQVVCNYRRSMSAAAYD